MLDASSCLLASVDSVFGCISLMNVCIVQFVNSFECLKVACLLECSSCRLLAIDLKTFHRVLVVGDFASYNVFFELLSI